MEIVVDAYDESERAMGWYCYLVDVLKFPFKAKCVNKKASSPLRVGQEIEVLDLTDADECAHEIKVNIEWEDDSLAVPLSQLNEMKTTAKTKQAIADWHYIGSREVMNIEFRPSIIGRAPGNQLRFCGSYGSVSPGPCAQARCHHPPE